MLSRAWTDTQQRISLWLMGMRSANPGAFEHFFIFKRGNVDIKILLQRCNKIVVGKNPIHHRTIVLGVAYSGMVGLITVV